MHKLIWQKLTFSLQYAWLKSRVARHRLQSHLQNAHSVTVCMYTWKSTWLQRYVHMQFYGCAAKYIWFPHVLNNQQDISLDGKPSYHISQRVILCTKPGVLVFFALWGAKKRSV